MERRLCRILGRVRSVAALGLLALQAGCQNTCTGCYLVAGDPDGFTVELPVGAGDYSWEAGTAGEAGSLVDSINTRGPGCVAVFYPILPELHSGPGNPAGGSITDFECRYPIGTVAFSSFVARFVSGDQNDYEVGSTAWSAAVRLTHYCSDDSCPYCWRDVVAANIDLTVTDATGTDGPPPDIVSVDYRRAFRFDLDLPAGPADGEPGCPDLGAVLSMSFELSASDFEYLPQGEPHEECGAH